MELTTALLLMTGFGAAFFTGTTFLTTGLATTFLTGAAFATTFGATLATTFLAGAALATGLVAFGTAFVTAFLTATVFAFGAAFLPTANVNDGGVKAVAVLARMAKRANFMVIGIVK